jgi:hypothetical protein
VRTLAVVLVGLVLVAAAAAQTDVVVVSRPSFPSPAGEPGAGGPRLELVSSRYHSSADLTPFAPLPQSVPRRFRGADLELAIRQQLPRRLFLVYGGRYLVGGGHAFDFGRFRRPPNGAWLEDIAWARQKGDVLYVEHRHLTYATATRSRNAYITAVDIESGRILWRSPALVANARTFVASGNMIVSGYGFTAEPDYLYLLSDRTGEVLDRLPLTSAPERIRLHGDRLLVRTYDRDVVARIVR